MLGCFSRNATVPLPGASVLVGEYEGTGTSVKTKLMNLEFICRH